ncbi:MAG: YchJ family metal-binding protein [Desulfuromonadales bacterium]|nr:YchJ family metal-binding protein [Desulfuromonadales bacterium]
MIQALTPEALIKERVAAFMQQDFQAIFYSYHPDAPFLHFFPDCDTYLSYATAEIAGIFEISACEILRSFQQGATAEILFRQRLHHQGEVLDSFEIGRCCRAVDGYWFFVAALRLDLLKLPVDLQSCSWDDLRAAGNDLWI